MTIQQVVSEILTYIRNNGGRYADWYAGITSDPQQRLFVEHAVKKSGDAWISRDAENETMARYAEKQFLDLGMIGDVGGGDSTTRYVYAYKIGPHTKEA